jgi:hypothetical protein
LRIGSGSRCSASALEPTRSQNSAVTRRRRGSRVAEGASFPPHSWQNFAPSGFAVLQLGQTRMSPSVVSPPLGHKRAGIGGLFSVPPRCVGRTELPRPRALLTYAHCHESMPIDSVDRLIRPCHAMPTSPRDVDDSYVLLSWSDAALLLCFDDRERVSIR